MAAADNTCFGIASYNLHGINNGRSGLLELCDNANIHVIAVQEHWLNDANLQLLNTIHPDFVGFSVSSMSDRLRTAVYYGRPFGGVGFLWRKTISNKVKIGAKAASGRCLCITVSLDSGTEVNLTNVYFPCYSSSIGYSNELSECLSFIEEVLDNGLPSVVMGDMNFSCNVDNEGYKQCYNVLSRYNVFHCDEFIDGGNGNCVTYYNHSLHHSSFLDHVFVTNTIRKDILYAEVA